MNNKRAGRPGLDRDGGTANIKPAHKLSRLRPVLNRRENAK